MAKQRLAVGLRVRVFATARHPLAGKSGTVDRIRISDGWPWVKMDEALPESLRSFPVGDPGGRANYVVIDPWMLEPES